MPERASPLVQVVVDGRPVPLDERLVQVVRRLVTFDPALARLSRWRVRVDVAGRDVRVRADTPVYAPVEAVGVQSG